VVNRLSPIRQQAENKMVPLRNPDNDIIGLLTAVNERHRAVTSAVGTTLKEAERLIHQRTMGSIKPVEWTGLSIAYILMLIIIALAIYVGWMRLRILSIDLSQLAIREDFNTSRWEALDAELRSGVMSFCDRHFPCDRARMVAQPADPSDPPAAIQIYDDRRDSTLSRSFEMASFRAPPVPVTPEIE
jgi:hypothetical protein